MNKEIIKKAKRCRRKAKIRTSIRGTKDCPRLSVFRSNKGMFLQLIDDDQGKTLISANSNEVKIAKKGTGENKKDKENSLGYKEQVGYELGKIIAQKAKDKNIKSAIFDRSGFKYHGRVKAVGDGARDGGLKI